MSNIFDSDFFEKSIMTEGGLIKTIPTIKREQSKPSQPKKIPADVQAFIKKVNGIFTELNGIVKEAVDHCGIENSTDLVKHYSEFKDSLRWKLNDVINGYNNNSKSETVEPASDSLKFPRV